MLVALLGLTVAVSFELPPTVNFKVLLLKVTPVTLTSVTLTVHSAVYFPSLVVTVIVTVPAFLAVTLPFSSTVAIVLSLLDHVTPLFVASLGLTVAVNLELPPTV